MQMIAKSMKFCFYTEHAHKRHRDRKINSSSDDEKIGFVLVLFKAFLQGLRGNKDKVRISNLLLSINFTKSLQLKVIKNMKQIQSLAK